MSQFPEEEIPHHHKARMSRAVMQFTKKRIADPVSALLAWLIRLLNQVLDALYDRLDLWQNKHHRTADFHKIRSLALYTAVIYTEIYVVRESETLPVQFLLWTTLGMLAASFGEKVLLAFFSMLANRQNLGEGTISLHRSPTRNVATGVDASPEQKYVPGTEKF